MHRGSTSPGSGTHSPGAAGCIAPVPPACARSGQAHPANNAPVSIAAATPAACMLSQPLLLLFNIYALFQSITIRCGRSDAAKNLITKHAPANPLWTSSLHVHTHTAVHDLHSLVMTCCSSSCPWVFKVHCHGLNDVSCTACSRWTKLGCSILMSSMMSHGIQVQSDVRLQALIRVSVTPLLAAEMCNLHTSPCCCNTASSIYCFCFGCCCCCCCWQLQSACVRRCPFGS
jgi:hypothetical protein